MSNRTGNLTNYHSHSLYCDGRANMEDFIRFALSEGFTSYGFSSHAPLPFSTAWTMEWDAMDDYLAEFHRLKAKYRIQAVPTFIVFKKGEAVWRHSGVIKGSELKGVIEQNS